MLHLNMLMSSFRITAIASLFRAGQQDGAIILGQRDHDKELVVAEVEQAQVEQEAPATHWVQGHYFPRGPEDTDLNSQAAIKATAIFGERTGITALADTYNSALADEAAKAAANAALEKVRAAAEGRDFTLVHVAYDDALTPKQVNVLLRGENEWDHPEFSTVEEIESDQRYDAAISEIKQILDDGEFYQLEADTELLDEARFIIEEHDNSSIIDALLASTGSMLVRYDLDVQVDTDYTSTDEDRREQAIEILAALGVDATAFDVESLIAAIIAILVESQDGAAYMFWHADVEELVKAARPFQQARFEGAGTAPAATITFTDVELLVLNKYNGSGYSAKLPGTFTVPFDATRLVTDEGDDGYGWNQVAGLVQSAFAATVTITAVESEAK